MDTWGTSAVCSSIWLHFFTLQVMTWPPLINAKNVYPNPLMKQLCPIHRGFWLWIHETTCQIISYLDSEKEIWTIFLCSTCHHHHWSTKLSFISERALFIHQDTFKSLFESMSTFGKPSLEGTRKSTTKKKALTSVCLYVYPSIPCIWWKQSNPGDTLFVPNSSRWEEHTVRSKHCWMSRSVLSEASAPRFLYLFQGLNTVNWS